MTAHVLYPRADLQPAGFSRYWVETVLRGALGFRGAVLSDDLGMAGAACAGPLEARAQVAFAAGCDLVLACTPADADAVLGSLGYDMPPASRDRLHALFGPPPATTGAVLQERLADARAVLSVLGA
jgi:beta-N-acetylhexosaminidase